MAFLLIGYRRARREDSPAALWLLAAGVGAFAVYTNVSHSGRAGLVYGAASAITLILWFVKLRDDYRHFQRHALNADVEEIADDVRAWRRTATDTLSRRTSADVRPHINGAGPVSNGTRP